MSPHLRGRVDIDKFNKGLKQHENFIPSIQGPTRYREGFEWMRTMDSGNIKLIDFSINNENRYLLSLSAAAICIHSRSGALLYTRIDGQDDGFGNIVNIPYSDDQIDDVRWSPEVEKMIFTHPLHPPFSLTANSIYDEVSLVARTKFYFTGATGTSASYNDDRFGPAQVTINGKESFKNVDVATIEFQYDGTQWTLVDTSGPTVLASASAGDEDDPTLATWAGDLSAATFTEDPEVSELFAADEGAGAVPLYARAAGAEGLTPWKWEQVAFTSHPFLPIDTTDTVLRISNEAEILRLTSSSSVDFADVVTAHTGNGLDTDVVYVEYKVGNQYGLGRALSTTTTPAAPADPTNSTIYVEPVDKVVNIEDPSVRLAAIIGDASNAPWTERDGVPDGDTHVRADALIFRTSHIGAWVRVGGNQLFTNVCDPTGSSEYNSQDGDVRWCLIDDYRGVEDHPVDFIYGTYAAEEFDSGSVYEVYEWGASIKGLITFDGTGTGRPSDVSAAVRETGGTHRFSMNHDLYTYTGYGNNGDISSWTGQAVGTGSAGAITANMSTQRQFDVVECSTVYTEGTTWYPKLVVPSGTVSAYDLVTDPDGLASHTAQVKSSRLFFDPSRDVGRYILGSLIDKWVLCKVTNVVSDYVLDVDLFTSIPRDDISGEAVNDGVFTKFRLGAWYTENYPYCVSFYEQRRVFAGTRKDPNLVWLSNLNDPTDFRTAEEDGKVLDTTGITYQLGTAATIIRWLAAGPTLIAGTESNEWQLRPNEFSAAITPSNIRITQETSIGSRVQGIRTGASVFFPHISGKQIHEFKFDFQTQQFVVSTVTKLVPDLFEEDAIKAMTFQFHPNSAFWILTEKGTLYSLTYRKEDDFYAWAKHSTPNGTFKDVVVLPKGDEISSEDQLWVIVERQDNQGLNNQLERLSVQFTDDLDDDYKANGRFLDSYVYSELTTPTTEISIPTRVIQDGKARIVVDGEDLGDVDAVSGANTLPDGLEATQYTLVGLPYQGKLQLNPQAFDGAGKSSYGQLKRTVSIRPYLYKSMGYQIGFSETELETIDPKGEDGTNLYTGFMDEHNILGSQFNVDDTPIIVQNQAYPLTLVSAVLKTEM